MADFEYLGPLPNNGEFQYLGPLPKKKSMAERIFGDAVKAQSAESELAVAGAGPAAALTAGAVAFPASGLAGLAMGIGGDFDEKKKLTGFNWSTPRAYKAMRDAEAAIMPTLSPTDEAAVGKLMYPIELLNKGATALGEKAAEVTGQPVAAPIVGTAAEFGGLMLGPAALKGAKRKVGQPLRELKGMENVLEPGAEIPTKRTVVAPDAATGELVPSTAIQQGFEPSGIGKAEMPRFQAAPESRAEMPSRTEIDRLAPQNPDLINAPDAVASREQSKAIAEKERTTAIDEARDTAVSESVGVEYLGPLEKAKEILASERGSWPIRFEKGKQLNKEERQKVMSSIGDAYKDNQAPVEFKGIDQRTGEEIYGYAYSPESMYKSGITGKNIRHYIELPDGTKAHPSELFPEITQAKIDAAFAERKQQERYAKQEAKDKDARISGTELGADQKQQANILYNKTRRKIEDSYFAYDDQGRVVRVDGKDQKDVSYYESQGFKKNVPKLSEERGSWPILNKLKSEGSRDITPLLRVGLPANSAAGKVNQMYENTIKRREERESLTLAKARNVLVRGFVDVSGNLKRDVMKIDPQLGKQVVMNRELLSGASAKASAMMDEFRGQVFDGLSPDHTEMLNRVIQSRRIIDIDKYKEGIKHPEGLTGKDHAQFLTDAEKVNPALFKEINDKATRYFEIQKEMVAELQKEGILSPESAAALMEHEYSPRRFFQHLDPENSHNFGGKKITVPDSGIKALDEGSLQHLENNAERLLSETVVRTQARIFRNRANLALHELATAKPDNGIVRLAKAGEDTPGGFEKVKVMIDGKPREMIMPWEMAQEWVKSDPLIDQALATMIGYISGAKILRPIATGYNPGFALTNIPRDLGLIWGSTTEYSSHLPIAAGQMIRDFAAVAPDVMKRTGMVKDYINQGGGMNFLTYYGRFSGKGYVGAKLDSIGKVMGWVGETSEIWSRMALRERAIRNGATPQEATWQARRYLDFNQGGNVAKGLDTAVPYLNAAIQGTRGLLRGARQNPGKTTYKMAQLGTVSAGLYLANTMTNPEAWNAIPDRDKEANFIITTPFSYTDDKGQKRYHYFKIAKDQGQRIVTSVFDAVTAFAYEGKIPSKQVLMAIQDLVSVAGIPPTLAAAASYLLNKDTWTYENVWRGPEGIKPSEEFTNRTHPAMVGAGQATGLSPERMGTAVGKLIPTNNPFIGLVGGTWKMITGDLSDEMKEKSAAQMLTEIPTVRRVWSTTNPYTPYREEMKAKHEEDKTLNWTQNRDFDKLADKYLRTRDQNVAKQMIEYVGKLPEPAQERLTRRFEKAEKLFKIPDRSWWMDMSDLSPEAKADMFYSRYSKSSAEQKQQMLETADRIGGFNSDRFIDRIGELVSAGKQPERVGLPAQ